MTAAVDRISNGGNTAGGSAGDVCRGPQRPKNKPQNLRKLRSVAWTAALGLLSRVPAASAGIFPYIEKDLEPAHLIYREAGMFAPGKGFLEIGAGGGDGKSFIRLTELKFEAGGLGMCPITDDGEYSSSCTAKTGHVELAIFEQKSFGDVGVAINDTRYYCCDQAALQMKACKQDQTGQLLLPVPSAIMWHRRLELPPGIGTSLEHTDVFRVFETGMYVVLMGNCDAETGPILIDGHSEWKNPYGYLPGEVYGCLPFFFVLAVFYLGMGIVWMTLCMIYIKDLLGVQMWASLVLLLGMIETGAQYFDYRDWNIEGARSTGAESFAILFGAAKRALSLSLVLMVCMGYGVVRPSLGRDVHKIMGLALVYFISSALWVALSSGSTTGDREFATRAGVNAAAILVFVNSTIMVAFYMWILQSIFGVIQHLRARRQTAKLNLYVQFRAVLGASVLFAIAWATYGIVRSAEEETNRRWESYWTVNAIWEVLYLAVLLATCFLLRPSMNNQRFSYSAVPAAAGGKHDDEGDILLQSISVEDAEYGGSLDDGDDGGDEFTPAAPVPKPNRPINKKPNQD